MRIITCFFGSNFFCNFRLLSSYSLLKITTLTHNAVTNTRTVHAVSQASVFLVIYNFFFIIRGTKLIHEE